MTVWVPYKYQNTLFACWDKNASTCNVYLLKLSAQTARAASPAPARDGQNLVDGGRSAGDEGRRHVRVGGDGAGHSGDGDVIAEQVAGEPTAIW